ncbi:MAG: hypothetical protein ACI4KB_13190 [Oscillospiraceae bacterium]
MTEKKDFKVFLSLILWALIPSVYLIIRMNIVAVNNVDINILGQMEWFDLIDEIIVTTMTVPLYSILKPEKSSRERNGFSLIISFTVYLIFTLIISAKVSSITEFMNAELSERYLFLQSFSMLIAYISSFTIILFVLNADYKTVCTLIISRVLMLSVFDYLLISKFNDIGASYSEITVNSILAIISMLLAFHNKYIGFGKCNLSWIKEWWHIGIFAGIQIFLDNFIYAIMICKMVNSVSESGNYWVANNFIWGWLLVPVSCLAEIIKKNSLEKLNMKNTWRFALGIAGLWIVSMPGWHWFIEKIMACNPDVTLAIVWPLIPFYFTYIVSALIDAWFISKGKTIYTTIISLFVNIVYYGILFILFKKGTFESSMMFIILMFGFGMVVHLILSLIIYRYDVKKQTN